MGVSLGSFHTRRALLVLIAAVATLVVLFGSSHEHVTRRTPDSVKQYLGSIPLPFRSACPASCPSDPFQKPGMLYWHPQGLMNETRWLPFNDMDMPGELPIGARIKDSVPYRDEVHPEVFANACPQYTAQLNNSEGGVGDRHWNWMRGRTLILMGSSHDRNNVQQFCEIIGGDYISWGWHVGGICTVQRLDFVIMNWFLYGMVDQEDLGFPPKDPPPNTFEHRMKIHHLPLMREHGAGGRKPDLILLSSLFWDENFLRKYGVKHRNRQRARGFLWTEIAWHRARLRELFAHVRSMFGENTPMMFRTRHIRAKMGADQLLHVSQLDQSGRAASRDMGVQLFTWGEKLEGYMQYSDNDQHFKLGPNTFVFGDMVLFYLKRAVTGCWACGDRH